MTLSVVYVPDTGHVVGALGVTGEQAQPDVATLVGPALPLRVPLGDGVTAEVLVRARDLAALAADDEPEVFTDPLVFGVEQVAGTGSTVVPKPTLLRLRPWSDQLVFNGTGLVVTVPLADGTKDTPVVALVSVGGETQLLAAAIEKGKTSVTLPVTVDTGTYGVLVLVAGWVGRLEPVNKP